MKNRAGRLSMGQGGNKLVAGLIAALIALTVLLVVVLFIINQDSQHDQQYIANTAEMRVLSQEIAKNATEAAGGTAEAFDQLRRSRDEFQQLWTNVTEGNPEYRAAACYPWSISPPFSMCPALPAACVNGGFWWLSRATYSVAWSSTAYWACSTSPKTVSGPPPTGCPTAFVRL